MKKLLLFIITLLSLTFCGCNRINEIENNRIITACIATKTKNEIKYGFYVSVPSGDDGGEDSGSKSSSKLYEFKADNFSHALSLFEDSGTEKTDISHISLFAANKEYFEELFIKDEKYIREKIPAIPLVYTCMVDTDYSDLIECINTEYGSKAEDFSKNVFDTSSTVFNCMMSEMSLSVFNNNYTSVLPVIKINNRGDGIVPEIISAAFYTSDSDIAVLKSMEYNIYGKWIKKYKKKCDGYELYADNGYLNVKTKNKKMSDLAGEYILRGTDILNCKYYAKKCFLTMESYDKFVKTLKKTNNIVFEDKL